MLRQSEQSSDICNLQRASQLKFEEIVDSIFTDFTYFNDIVNLMLVRHWAPECDDMQLWSVFTREINCIISSKDSACWAAVRIVFSKHASQNKSTFAGNNVIHRSYNP